MGSATSDPALASPLSAVRRRMSKPRTGRSYLNLGKEAFHVHPFSFGQQAFGGRVRTVDQHSAPGLADQLHDPGFQIPAVGFGEILIFGNNDADAREELLVVVVIVSLEPLENTVAFTNINEHARWVVGISTHQYVDTAARRDHRFARPIAELSRDHPSR